MNSDDRQNNTEHDLQRLEAQVDELVQSLSSLKSENRELRAARDQLMNERAQLIEKTELARTRVEAMISRLKSMESSS